MVWNYRSRHSRTDLLANVGYRGGVDALLSALDADRDLFGAEVALSQIQLNELLGVVLLYKALGGDWQDRQSASRSASVGMSAADQVLSRFTMEVCRCVSISSVDLAVGVGTAFFLFRYEEPTYGGGAVQRSQMTSVSQ